MEKNVFITKTANVFLAALLFVSTCIGQEKNYTVVVVEQQAARVGFYDSRTGAKFGSAAVGFKPHEIELSKDGKTAYVSNFGIEDYDFRLGTPGASVSVIDVRRMREKYRFSTEDLPLKNKPPVSGKAPHGVKLRPPSERELFVNTEVGGDLMLVYDLKTKRLARSFAVPKGTHNFVFSPDGDTLFLMAAAGGVFRINPETGAVAAQMKLPTPVRGLIYTADGRHLIASGAGEIALLDPADLSVQKHFKELGGGQIIYSAPTPDGKYILAPAPAASEVAVLEVETGKIVRRIVTGKSPIAVKISPGGRFAYVSNAEDSHVSRINLKDFSVKNFADATGANGLAISRIKMR